MAEKIGLINFDAFDLQKIEEYRAMRNQAIQQGKVLSLAELHPSQIPWKSIGGVTDDPQIKHRFTQELMPYMEQYYEYFYKAAVNREILERWALRQRELVYAEHEDWKRLDILEEWLRQLMAIKAYAELGRIRTLFRRAHLKVWIHEAMFAAIGQDVGASRMYRTAENFGRVLSHPHPVPIQNADQTWRPITKDTTEHEQIFATQIKVKTRKWMQLLAASGYAATSAAEFQDVNNGIVSPPAMSSGFGMKKIG